MAQAWRLEKGRAGYDVAHHFMTVATYGLPIGKGRPWLNRVGIVNQVLGGWELTPTTTLESGQATSVTYAGSPNWYLPMGGSRPNVVVPMEQAIVENWDIGANRFPTSLQNPYLRFDAFAYPRGFQCGDARSQYIRSPRNDLAAVLVVQDLANPRADAIPVAGGYKQLPVQAAEFPGAKLDLQREQLRQHRGQEPARHVHDVAPAVQRKRELVGAHDCRIPRAVLTEIYVKHALTRRSALAMAAATLLRGQTKRTVFGFSQYGMKRVPY